MILNIGLGANYHKVPHNVAKVVEWLAWRTVPEGWALKVHRPAGDTLEYVLVVQCNYTAALSTFNQLSELLKQDCIAVFDESTKEGYLIGPRALNWGVFNPRKFLRS